MGARSVPLWLTLVCLAQSSALLSHVERYELVRPQRLPGRQRRSLRDGQLYPETVRYELTVEGKNHTIHLEKNRDLIGTSFTETYYSEDGKRVTTSPNEAQDHCYYHGHIEGVEDSSVSVATCSGLSGFLKARQQVYLIEPLGNPEDGEHALYRQEHLKVSGRPRCGSSSNTSAPYSRNQGPQPAGFLRSRLQKSKLNEGPQRFVELFVVADNTEYSLFGSKTRERILGVINHVDKLYRPLNIRIMLVGLEIWTNKDEIFVDSDSEKALDNFLHWHKKNLHLMKKHDSAQFVTGKDFIGDTVGLANKYAMCTENSGGINQDHHESPIGLASTIAHEMGHNFGLSHDAPNCACGPSYSSGDCVMADKLRTGSQAFPEFFSSCSIEQLAEFLKRAQPTCLSKPSSSTKYMAVTDRCGNAMLDPGEECDCGTVTECKNPCCDASTCRLTQGSACADGRCCENCQFREAGGVCRRSADECDLPEYCTGASQHCPEDSFEMNGKLCYNHEQGYCYDGQCPTHKQHCWRLFGAGATVGIEACFDLNRQGEGGANCRRRSFNDVGCTKQDLKCGLMFCEGGGESISGKIVAYKVGSIDCKTVVDDDKIRNISMVPKGTRCGPDKVCLDNKCVDLSVYGVKEECAKKCNNNGVCNHKKECHCNPGWAPPFCAIQYADSPKGHVLGIIIGVCVVLAVLLTIAAVIVRRLCCKKDNVDNYTSKRKVHSAPDRLNPMFQEPSAKTRPLIGEPSLVESTATQACSLLGVTPSRPAPQPPKKVPAAAPATQTQPTKLQPPVKPLPPLERTQRVSAKPPPPPVPPVKPCPT